MHLLSESGGDYINNISNEKKKPVIKLGQLLQCFSQVVSVDSLNLNSTSLFNFTWSSDSTARITVRPILMVTNKVDSYVYIDVCLWIVCP